MKLISVVGLSGSGKTSILQVLGDEDYLILDSLGVNTIIPILKIIQEDNIHSKVALVVDFNDAEEFNDKCSAISKVVHNLDINWIKYYVYADIQTIISRYKQYRRLHPLVISKKKDSLEESIKLEIAITKDYQEKADYIFDTSSLSIINLRKQVLKTIKKDNKLLINVISFGFKYGSILDADYVFDLRFLPNPYYEKELREKTGLDNDVYNYVFSFEDANKFYSHIYELLLIAQNNYIKEGRVVTTIAFGCTGGQHRSVSFVRRLANDLSNKYDVSVIHKQLGVRK